MERARRDEQDVIGPHHAVLGVDRRALDDRQQVALHALARDVGPVHAFAAGDLVDLVDEDDAGLLGARDRFLGHRFHVDQLGRLLLREQVERLGDLQRAGCLVFFGIRLANMILAGAAPSPPCPAAS